LPVGPPASAVLANAVLSAGDAAIGDTPFLRWVDDFLIFARNEAEAHGALEHLSDALGRLGLSLADDKTSVGVLDLGVSPVRGSWNSGASPA
jgi:hypothetical protein